MGEKKKLQRKLHNKKTQSVGETKGKCEGIMVW